MLLLMRHAKSAWPDVPDHERPLGHWLAAAGYLPDQVMCSTARRASPRDPAGGSFVS